MVTRAKKINLYCSGGLKKRARRQGSTKCFQLVITMRVVAGKKAHFNPQRFLSSTGLARKDVECQKGDVIFSQGEQARTLFYIQSGTVKLTAVSKQGKEAIVALLGPHSLFGEDCVAGDLLRTLSATAIAPCHLFHIGASEIIRLLHGHQEFSDWFVTYLIGRTIRVEEDLVDHLFNSTEKRLARALLRLARYGKGGKPEMVIPQVSQATLAEMVGTTRSRVNLFMNKFKKLGFIYYNGGMQVNTSLLDFVLHE
jgi:CRP/FNR family transcriptional regulator, cyclic AMP receptor protein